jgi:hypothetical protein
MKSTFLSKSTHPARTAHVPLGFYVAKLEGVDTGSAVLSAGFGALDAEFLETRIIKIPTGDRMALVFYRQTLS